MDPSRWAAVAGAIAIQATAAGWILLATTVPDLPVPGTPLQNITATLAVITGLMTVVQAAIVCQWYVSRSHSTPGEPASRPVGSSAAATSSRPGMTIDPTSPRWTGRRNP